MLSAGIMNSKTEFRSICRKNLNPRPLPSLAPSIMPGMSAITNEVLSRCATIPRFGVSVVKA